MHQTMIGGTIYEIDHGNALVDSTQYTIDHGNTMVDNTQYKIEFASGSSFEWVGWSNATWEDINNLCYAKQIGLIDSWPSDVVLGGTKSVTLSEAVLGTTTHDVMIIGMDQDGEGTLTFQTKNCLTTTTVFGTSDNADPGGGAWWGDSGCTARAKCQEYYNAFPGKAYIKTITKQTSNARSSVSLVDTQETVWLPSRPEVGHSSVNPSSSDWTKDGSKTAYSYYTDNAKRIKYENDDSTTARVWWTRSRHSNGGTVGSVWTGGQASSVNYSFDRGLAPAFVIGNPEAQTIG